ncbi:MAG: hypothetical protein II576_04350 [Prevotella sp.]|jgi:hypothetical protein|nr:hypothetical protein [Prevotella sp.]MBQ1587869.1 hypothetical protein [Prevotella sp.]MBQ1627304.1 hypothetical protein [Prevotella sp.]MBQ1667465.1 hypothetical protein [Prevotella sp.]MBQ1700298.1 hypothetical protein [Prevotella sp.]
MVVLVAFIATILGSCKQNKENAQTKELTTYEVFDSLSNMLPKGSIVVARFPDEERHCMYYLNSGILYYFDGKQKNLEEVMISGVDNGSVESALLDKEEKFISIEVNFGKVNKLYRLNTMNRNIVDMDQTVASSRKDSDEPEKEKKASKPRKEEKKEEVEQEPQKQKEPEHEHVLQDVMMEE